MELKFKLLAIVISLSLTACGGGSSSKESADSSSSTDTSEESNNESGSTDSSESTDTPSNEGDNGNGTTSTTVNETNTTGNCVTIARPQVGQIEVIKTTGVSGSPDVYLKRKVTALSNTSYSEEFSVRSGSETGEIITASTTSETYTIANNFRDVTQTTSKSSASLPDATGATSIQEVTILSNYSPYRRTPVDRVCEGQTWTTDYDDTNTTTFGTLLAPTTSTTHHSEIHTIEAININKTVPAGSFNTVQYKFEDGNSIVTIWMDITTAASVAFETKDTLGADTSSSELISFTRQYYEILKKLAQQT